MKLTRLRIAGFKTFVEPTDFLIEPGLTGVVGPNGCGKSNLVEALRWVMGENSHKNMRATGMDDVIFSGSGNRPARNWAEVMLTMTDPAPDSPDLREGLTTPPDAAHGSLLHRVTLPVRAALSLPTVPVTAVQALAVAKKLVVDVLPRTLLSREPGVDKLLVWSPPLPLTDPYPEPEG